VHLGAELIPVRSRRAIGRMVDELAQFGGDGSMSEPLAVLRRLDQGTIRVIWLGAAGMNIPKSRTASATGGFSAGSRKRARKKWRTGQARGGHSQAQAVGDHRSNACISAVRARADSLDLGPAR